METKKKRPGALLLKFKHYIMGLEVVDYRIILSIIFLLMFGFIMVYSASSATDGISTVKKQMMIGVGGIVAMLAVSYIDYHLYEKFAWLLYILALGSMLLVRVPGLGTESHGATRWIAIGSMTIQPAEFMKPAIVILMAFILTRADKQLKYFRAFFMILLPGVIASVMVLVVTKNLSTALIVAGVVAFMIFVAYPNKNIWAWVAVCLFLAIVGCLIFYNLKIVTAHEATLANVSATTDSDDSSYRLTRILAWLFPDDYPDSSRQSRYALYSIGFGGLFGRGLGCGTMKYYLPEPTNDFIFAVIAEELGIVGCAIIMFLFCYQIWRILTVARHAKDRVGGYIAAGIGIHVALQVLLNIGVTTSVLPNTGISLPYISNGGTALFIQLCEMGIVLNISRQIPGRKIKVEGTSAQDDQETSRLQQKIA